MGPLLSLNIAHAEKKSGLLHSFSGAPDGSNANGVVRAADGTLYGTTEGGGENHAGTIYKVTPGKKEVILYNFQACCNGAYPFTAPVLDDKGNLYGTTCCEFTDAPGSRRWPHVPGGEPDQGVVWRLTPDGTYTVLYDFSNGDEVGEGSGIARDKKGNIYGVTYGGGANGDGVVYKVTPQGALQILHDFAGPDGDFPAGRPLLDNNGNIFGTTGQGGQNGYGTIYELSPDGTETVLYSFTGQDDGATPASGVVRDHNGNFYGTTQGRGTNNYGTLFQLSPSGALTVLHAFGPGPSDGNGCGGAPTVVKKGKSKVELYGLCTFGGAANDGTAYKLSANGQYKVIHDFTGGSNQGQSDAGQPQGSPAVGPGGKLYGASSEGGSAGDGTVFELR
jgi:uncharacterized repeat protein (TIGR03803 family)